MRTPGASEWAMWDQIKDISLHTILPAIVLGLGSTASFMRYTRSSMLEVIRQDYIRTARSKGLNERVVIYKHALRNALIPIITLLGFWIPGPFLWCFNRRASVCMARNGIIGLSSCLQIEIILS